MMLADTNVLVNAFNAGAERHSQYKAWVEAMVNGPEPYGVADFALTGLVRIVTDPRIFRSPAPLAQALEFTSIIRGQPHAEVVSPGGRFWEIFADLCRKADAVGKLVPDAYLAALALERGCELITADRDFRRFPGLRWRHPLDRP